MSMVRPTPMPKKPVKQSRQRKGLRRVSEKLAAENVEYAKACKEWRNDRIAKDGYLRCEFVGEPHIFIDLNRRCFGEAMTVPHHKKRRGKYLSDKRYFMATCFAHHQWIEDHKNEARERDYILYR